MSNSAETLAVGQPARMAKGWKIVIAVFVAVWVLPVFIVSTLFLGGLVATHVRDSSPTPAEPTRVTTSTMVRN